ncbi:MAG: hypothetical protein M1818_003068 [Claussenomyces sp. TS43310]|nr:MAG: hypothetical protein M1818_003068 [Claussenomyces sp. TS43310]
MSSRDKTVVAFDLYGTLLSTESIAKELASHFGNDRAQAIATLWRRYQLEYTWRLNSMNLYKPFNDITLTSLQHALAESKESLSEHDIKQLMRAYDSLAIFPDVKPALQALADNDAIDAYVFSNGTDAMVGSSVRTSPDLSPHASVFKDLITVEPVRAFKPDPRVYRHLVEQVGKSSARKEDVASVWLVSGNSWDVVGARAVGLHAAWVDRAGNGWSERLGVLASGGPTVIVKGVEEVVGAIEKWIGESGENQERGVSAGLNQAPAAMGPG